MIMIKILFFDIDGTLLELGQKEMHQELVDALNLVKEKGIKIILATGRPPFVVPKFHGIEFDGVLSFNGSYCYTNNELIYKNPMDKTDIQTFVDNAKKLNKAVTLAGINKMGCNFDDEILEEYNLKIKFIKMKKLEVQKGAKPLSPNIKDYCVAIILAFC